MHPDVIDLVEFYNSALGQLARRQLRQRIRGIWSNVTGLRVLGLGYATPYLRQFRDEAERVIAVMPSAQGVVHWPPEGPCLTALTDEGELPLPDFSMDRVLVVHGLEGSEQVGPMLSEIWRVLAPGGKLLLVVPNRRGLWARFEHTPFGHGRPYTPPQLSRLLRDHLFSPTLTTGGLFLPPWRRRFVMRGAGALERLGERWWPGFAGVLLVEAGKQIYGLIPKREARRARRMVPALRPAAARIGLQRRG